MEIKVTYIKDAEAWLGEHGPHFSIDRFAAVYPTGGWRFREPMQYKDTEEGTTKECSWRDHLEALQLMFEGIGDKFHYMNFGPKDLLDLGNWDNVICDMYFQLVYHKDVIYG